MDEEHGIALPLTNDEFKDLKEVPEDSIEAKLFKIIDDIDTAGDMFNPEITAYVEFIDAKIKEAHKSIISDGYKLFYAK